MELYIEMYEFNMLIVQTFNEFSRNLQTHSLDIQLVWNKNMSWKQKLSKCKSAP